MTGGAKMLIITSDEDVIREFSSKKLKNTQIIDLDIHKHISFDDKSSLTQLTQHNEKSEEEENKSLKAIRKAIDLRCAICGAHAIGFNYDALSCGSCKAFFVRNAARDLESMKCLTENGRCVFHHSTRPKCKQCRLRKCFEVGMKKELIRNKEKRRRRRRKYLGKYRIISSEFILNSESPSQTIERFPTPMDESDQILDEILSDDDLIKIENMGEIFSLIFNNNEDKEYHLYENQSDRMLGIISWSKYVGESALDFIRFYRHIIEFEDLNANDRFLLIKNNLFSIYFLSKSFSSKFNEEQQKQFDEKQILFYNLCFGSNFISDSFIHLRNSIIEMTKNDSIYLSLLLTILIFSHSLSINEQNQTLFNDLTAIHQAQSIYTKFLWNYLRKKHGENQACKQFSQIVSIIMRIQSLCKIIGDFFRNQLITLTDIDQITSLMQSLPFIP